MCQTRFHDHYIDYLQGLANEAVEADRRSELIQKALVMPEKDRRILWEALCAQFATEPELQPTHENDFMGIYKIIASEWEVTHTGGS